MTAGFGWYQGFFNSGDHVKTLIFNDDFKVDKAKV